MSQSEQFESLESFTTASSRTADKFVIRLKDRMREAISDLARASNQSMNAWIISQLENIILGKGEKLPRNLYYRDKPLPLWIPQIGQLVVWEDEIYGLADFEFIESVPMAVLRRDSKAKDDKVVDIGQLSPYFV